MGMIPITPVFRRVRQEVAILGCRMRPRLCQKEKSKEEKIDINKKIESRGTTHLLSRTGVLDGVLNLLEGHG